MKDRNESPQPAIYDWPNQRPVTCASAILLVAAIVFLWEMLFSSNLPFLRDLFFDFVPQHRFAGELLRKGEFPLWNPYSGFGKPFAADPIPALYYPLHALFYVLPIPLAIRLYCLLHLWIGGMGMFVLARQWRFDFTPALSVALVAMFSSWTVTAMEFANNFCSAAWAPWIFWAGARLLEEVHAAATLKNTKVCRYVGLLSIFFAVQYFCGFAEFVAFAAAFLVCYLVVESLQRRNTKTCFLSLVAVGIAGTLAIFLVSPQLLPGLEFLGQSERSLGVNAMMQMASVPLRHLANLFLPFINGYPGYTSYWSESVFEFWIGTAYVGILPLLLAGGSIYWLRCGPKSLPHTHYRTLTLLLWASLVFGILMSMGKFTPLYALVHDIVPGFSFFRFPSKFLVLVLLAMCFLSALGLQALIEICQQEVSSKVRSGITFAGALVFALAVVLYFYASSHPNFFFAMGGKLFPSMPAAIDAQLASFRGLLWYLGIAIVIVTLFFWQKSRCAKIAALLLIFLNLFFVTRHLHPLLDEKLWTTPPDVAISGPAADFRFRSHSTYNTEQQWLYASANDGLIKWAVSAGVGDTWLPHKIHSTYQGGMKLRRQVYLRALLDHLSDEQVPKLYDALAVRQTVGGDSVKQILAGNGSGELLLQSRATALPRAFLVHDWISESEEGRIIDLLTKTDFGQQAIIEGAAPPRPAHIETNASEAVEWITDNPTKVELSATTKTPAFLVLSDAWYPRWQARVDGKAAPIYRANYHFRGLFLEPGTHKIEFQFEPGSFRTGLVLCGAGIVLLGVIWKMSAAKK